MEEDLIKEYAEVYENLNKLSEKINFLENELKDSFKEFENLSKKLELIRNKEKELYGKS